MRIPVLVTTLFVASTMFSSSEAATIDSSTSFLLPGFSTGTLTVGPAASPNNDNVTTAGPNLIHISIVFNTDGLGPVDMEFALANSAGATEYRVVPAGIGLVNNTGSPFTGFLAELGFGTGSSFVRSVVADGLDFDTPDNNPAPTLPAFAALTQDTDSLRWSGGTIPSGAGFSIGFSLDVPDGLQAFHPDGVNRFTLRLTPVSDPPVPEPATIFPMLFGLSAIGLTLRRSRSRS